jgi:ATP-dependent phosphoenolpyruvate carboxykinase
VIAVNLAKGLVLIGGTSYAGEMKKSVFTALNYLLPAKNVMPMHCSANGDLMVIRPCSLAFREPARQLCRQIPPAR